MHCCRDITEIMLKTAYYPKTTNKQTNIATQNKIAADDVKCFQKPSAANKRTYLISK